jgi:hypothetical protein
MKSENIEKLAIIEFPLVDKENKYSEVNQEIYRLRMAFIKGYRAALIEDEDKKNYK